MRQANGNGSNWNGSNGGLKKNAIKVLFNGGMHLAPFLPDQMFGNIFEGPIKKIKYPDGQDFMRHGLVCMKKFLSSPQTKRSAMRMLSLMLNMTSLASAKRKKFFDAHGYYPPHLMAISPSMRCNLRCVGCYAGEYQKADDLDSGVLERIVCEAEDMGIGFVVVIGGEPFFSKDVLNMWEKHPNVLFHVYTNGTLIDKDMARRLAEYGNVLPCISVEGYEPETDARRGKGTFARIMTAMENLREAGLLFGFSATATRHNNELVSSDEFVDFYVKQGCFIGWYFNYLPIGRSPDVGLMPTPQQRIDRWNRVRALRKTKPMLLADFWCDGALTGGCLAGGRLYFHVTNKGDVEPCVFAHFAVDNIRKKPLAEALNTDFFRAIRRRQPFSSNLLRPCMIIDSPSVLRDVVTQNSAYPTHDGAETIITDLAEQLDCYASKYGELADEAWKQVSGQVMGQERVGVPAKVQK